MNRYLIMVEGFVCPRDPRGYFVRWAFVPLQGPNGSIPLREQFTLSWIGLLGSHPEGRPRDGA